MLKKSEFTNALTEILNSDAATMLKLQQMLQKVGKLPGFLELSGELDPSVRELSDAIFQVDKPKVVPIPFKRIPSIVQEQILKSTSLLDIFNFSLQSPEAERIVQNLKIAVTELDIIFDSLLIKLNDKSFWVRTRQDDEARKTDMIANVKVEVGMDREEESEERFVIYCETKQERAEVWRQMLFKVRKIFRTDKISMRSHDFESANFVFENVTRQFQNLYISWLHDDPEQYPLALEGLSADKLELCLYVNSSISLTNEFKAREVKFESGSYLTRECILKLNCEKLEAKYSKLNPSDMVAFFKKWKDGGFDQLKACYFGIQHRFDPNEILEDLEAVKCQKADFTWEIYYSYDKRPDLSRLWNIESVNGKLGYLELYGECRLVLFCVL